METIEKLDKNLCTGCGACYNICPVNAILMEKNKEGFLEPVIDKSKCIKCGLCFKVCPQLNNIELNETRSVFAIKGENIIRENSSSGGVFGTIAKWALSQNGYVFGAAFTKDFSKVIHVKCSNENSLKEILKSKYLQSEINKIYQDVKNTLENTSAPVVFSGCPCQVAALKKYLNKNYKNLLTIDILCHGVVSPSAYQKFIKDFFGDVDSTIVNVDFRSKKLGWSTKNLLVQAEDGTTRISKGNEDYFKAFLWGYSQRKVCFSCKYASKERVGDITLGDFWGIDNILPEINDKKGISLVLCNTDLGLKAIKQIQSKFSKIVELDYEKMFNAVKDINWALYKPGIMPENRDVFFYRLSRGDSFSQALKYASYPKYDVGIFGWWFEDNWTNYGSTLTYYALMEYVSSLGLSVCMITSPFHKKENASNFIKKHGYVMSNTYKFEDFKKHNENIDTFLIGSDQLWFYDCYKSWGHSLFLDFVDEDKKKISYSTSFGHKDPKIPDSEIPILKKFLNRFDAVSSRENDGVEILNNKFNIDSVQVLDPVFICDYKNWESIAFDAERKTTGDFIFAYILDPNEEKNSALGYLSKKLNMPVVSITDKQYKNNEKVEILRNYGVLEKATIEELIYHLMNAKYVLTDSYHGLCFSLIFKKNFATIINPKRGTSRFETLATLFDIGDRLITNPNFVKKNENLLKRPEYNVIEPKILKEIERSKAWLKNQLFNKHKNIIQKTIINPHERILKDFDFLNAMGYTVGRWLKDNGIDHISIYCEEQNLDIFEKFLISLQFDDSIVVDGFYSNKDFEFNHYQSKNFGKAIFRQELPESGTLIYVSDEVKKFDAQNCKVLNLLTCLWRAEAFAMTYRPLVEYKKLHPNVNIVCVDYPRMPPEGKRDERESEMLLHSKDYEYENLINKIPATFNVFSDKKYSKENWLELFGNTSSEIGVNKKRHYLDYSGKLKNIKNGHRITLNQPTKFSKTIYMLGGCGTFGYGCADEDTSSSNLQKLFNENNIEYKVENYGSFLNYRTKDRFQFLFDLKVNDGDVIIIEVWSKLPNICEKYFDYLDLKELFYRPHNYGDVFVDYSQAHLSYIGQKVFAEKIFEFLKSKNLYLGQNEKLVAPKIEIEPLNIFGIPKQYYSFSEEFTHPELKNYLDSLKKYRDRVGAIVMNCNPFTLGHRYLIETASKQCKKLYVFVVEEDKSIFKFKDRIDLVKKGTADLKNVVVLPSGKFMISSLTFTDYFNKSELQDKIIDPSMDVEIFAKQIAPALGVNIRFVGEEPLDKVTKQYNDTMRRILPQYGIEFCEIKRKEESGAVISASRVRKLLEE